MSRATQILEFIKTNPEKSSADILMAEFKISEPYARQIIARAGEKKLRGRPGYLLNDIQKKTGDLNSLTALLICAKYAGPYKTAEMFQALLGKGYCIFHQHIVYHVQKNKSKFTETAQDLKKLKKILMTYATTQHFAKEFLP